MSSADVVNIVIAAAVLALLLSRQLMPRRLYLVVTLTIQRFILLRRVAQQEAAGQVPVVDPHVSV